MNSESIEIMLEIMKLKKKLVKSIVPEQTMGHLDVIGKEVKAMILESLIHETKNTEKTSKVKKVEIG